MNTLVRLGTQKDLKQLVDMQEAYRAEISVHDALTFSRELCTENMKLFIEHPSHLIIVAHKERTEELLGFMWLVMFQPHYSTEFYYSEAYTYIKPLNRKALVLKRLIDKSKIISRNSGAKYLEFGSSSGDKKLSRAYHKRYVLAGEVFNIELRG